MAYVTVVRKPNEILKQDGQNIKTQSTIQNHLDI